MSAVTTIAPGVFRIEDTCAVYVVTAEHGASDRGIAIDFGSGRVLDHLQEMGLTGLDAVLMTHHHRDQGEGLPRAVAAGIPIVVPPVERELFDDVEEMWATRTLANDYNLRQDRFSLLSSVPVDHVAAEYRTEVIAGIGVYTMPTPGHTMGSVSYLVHRGDRTFAFTGDLIHSPGRVWSLAATQWSYTESEGPAMVVLSCLILGQAGVDVLLPSHGEVMADAPAALALLADRMQAYVDSRRIEPWDLRDRLERPYVRLTEHLLVNRTANACSYVLLSGTGEALVIDYGYDLSTGWPSGTDRAARRPWLASLPALRRDFGVRSIEVALATHYHDDHVAGLPLLREVEGTEIWVPEHVARIMEDPLRTDLPCQWFDPITADRELVLGGTVEWRGHAITTHDLPGHTLYAAAFEFEVDGVRVLVTGDQQTAGASDDGREVLNYQYRNRFRRADYRASAALYRRIAPQLLLTGHWQGAWVDDRTFDVLAEQGRRLEESHDDLLPYGSDAPPTDGNLLLLEPFHRRLRPGEHVTYTARVSNPSLSPREVRVTVVVPDGWVCLTPTHGVVVDPGAEAMLRFRVITGDDQGRRQVVGASLVIDGHEYGMQADAVVDVVEPRSSRRVPAVDPAGS